MALNILLCTGSFDPAHGGPPVSVSQLGAGLARDGVTVGLWAPDGSAITSTLVKKEARLLPLTGNLRQVFRSFQPDIVHDNGIWLPHNHLRARLAIRYNLSRVASIRGMLEPWALAHKRVKKSSPGSPIRNATLTGPPLLFHGNRRVRGSLLDYGMGGVLSSI